jgi:hypothetical protein
VAKIKITEKAWQKQVIELAHMTGWIVAHFRTASQGTGKKRRFLTPVGADGKGFPDLVIVRERVIYAELKVGYNDLRPEQTMWLQKLAAAGQETYVWRPEDAESIARIMQNRQ